MPGHAEVAGEEGPPVARLPGLGQLAQPVAPDRVPLGGGVVGHRARATTAGRPRRPAGSGRPARRRPARPRRPAIDGRPPAGGEVDDVPALLGPGTPAQVEVAVGADGLRQGPASARSSSSSSLDVGPVEQRAGDSGRSASSMPSAQRPTSPGAGRRPGRGPGACGPSSSRAGAPRPRSRPRPARAARPRRRGRAPR